MPIELEEKQQTSSRLMKNGFEVDTLPDVALGVYKGLTVSRRKKTVSEKDIDTALSSASETLPDQGISELRRSVREVLERKADLLMKRDLERQVAERLLESHPFCVPPVLVTNLSSDILEHLKKDFLAGGGNETLWSERLTDLTVASRDEAEARLRLTWLMTMIAQAENLTVSDQDAEAAVIQSVSSLGEVAQKKAMEGLLSRLDEVKGRLLEDAVYSFLLNHARVVDVSETL